MYYTHKEFNLLTLMLAIIVMLFAIIDIAQTIAIYQLWLMYTHLQAMLS